MFEIKRNNFINLNASSSLKTFSTLNYNWYEDVILTLNAIISTYIDIYYSRRMTFSIKPDINICELLCAYILRQLITEVIIEIYTHTHTQDESSPKCWHISQEAK